MDEATVRERAEQHAAAVVAGDLSRAGSDLAGEAPGQASVVMRKLPRPPLEADVIEVNSANEGYLAVIRYRGEGGETLVGSRWADHEGRLAIVALQLM